MEHLDLKPTHAAVKAYYGVLGQYGQLHIDHEMAVSSAFQDLLSSCARKFHWTLVPQFSIERKGASPIRVDGAVLDTFSLTRGLWEAKDSHDDLEKEIKAKLAVGYPRQNIIFQAPERAVLYQNGMRQGLNGDLTDAKNLVELLKLFFEYRLPHHEEWEQAVEEFRERLPEIAQAVQKLIEQERRTNPKFVQSFEAFYAVCRQAINPNLSVEAVEGMLIQHLLTERIFRKIFDNSDFTRRNVVAVEIEKVIDSLTSRHFNRDEFLSGLDRFYKAIELNAENTENYSEKQAFLNTVYERFFQGYSPKEADTHGIVYTPQPIVNFMVRSVEEILQKEFGRSLSDRDVHVLDPFVGTGNFITRVMREIKTSALPYKYENELHCNEVMLLPYYVASMNIEHEYLERTGEYKPFAGICLVDTFDLRRQITFLNEENARRVEKQKSVPIFVVIANPPYNAWQLDENDNNKKRKYDELDERVAETYVRSSHATNKSALSDVYVKAFRWAADRIGEEGVIAYVSNNGFVDGLAFDGMRRQLLSEFSAVYHFNLKGNARTSGERRRREAGNIFDNAIRVGIGITFLVKSKGASTRGSLFYFEAGDYLSASDKRSILETAGSLGSIEWIRLKPDAQGSWLSAGEVPSNFVPMEQAEQDGIFRRYSVGVKTNRDAWAYNFSSEALEQNVLRTINFFNSEVDRYRRERPENLDDFVDYAAAKISWSRDLKGDLRDGNHIKFSQESIYPAVYRPFVSSFLYFDAVLNEEIYSLLKLFPAKSSGNLSIWITGPGSEKPFMAIASSRIGDIHLVGAASTGQGFPLHTFSEHGTERLDNITDWALQQYRARYQDTSIGKCDIFHYVYAVLHHPTYRERYAANLRRELPRIPFLKAGPSGRNSGGPQDDKAVFWALVKAGERLADLHVNYEKQPEYPLKRTETGKLDWQVKKMRLNKDKTLLVYNSFLTLSGIPPETYEYRLGNRSALEWVVDQYQVSTDKRSGITNDPNRADDPEYIVRLIGQVVYLSLETVKIVKSLPEFVIENVESAKV